MTRKALAFWYMLAEISWIIVALVSRDWQIWEPVKAYFGWIVIAGFFVLLFAFGFVGLLYKSFDWD